VRWLDARDPSALACLDLAGAAAAADVAVGQEQPPLVTAAAQGAAQPAVQIVPDPCYWQQQQQQRLTGIVLNVRARGPLAALLRGRHWLSLRPVAGVWYNLDSRLRCPLRFGSTTAAAAGAGNGVTADRQQHVPAAALPSVAAGRAGGRCGDCRIAAGPADAGEASSDDTDASGAEALRTFLVEQLSDGAHILLVYDAPEHTAAGSGSLVCVVGVGSAGSLAEDDTAAARA
jgi:hypothetical protein